MNLEKMEYWNNGIPGRQHSNIPLFQEMISVLHKFFCPIYPKSNFSGTKFKHAKNTTQWS
jgi:hypothetical protein